LAVKLPKSNTEYRRGLPSSVPNGGDRTRAVRQRRHLADRRLPV